MVVGERNDLITAVATLAAVGVSVPLIARARRWVDRRFFRYRYDSAAVIARVAEDLRSTISIEALERHAEEVIDEVFAPASVQVWLA